MSKRYPYLVEVQTTGLAVIVPCQYGGVVPGVGSKIQIIWKPKHAARSLNGVFSEFSTTSRGKASLTDQFKEQTASLFTGKWSAYLKDLAIGTDGVSQMEKWIFRFKNPNDAMLMKLRY